MEKTEKRQLLDLLAKNASDDYLAGYFNGFNAAKEKESKEKESDKKPA